MNTDERESTAVVFGRARGGDRRAGEELAARYSKTLRRWAHGRLPAYARSLVDTDDLVQSSLARALGRIGSLQLEREGAFLAYVRRTLLNQVLDEIRRAHRRPEQPEITDDLPARERSPLEDAIGKEVLERYESALALLTEAQHEAVILRIELGFRYREIAEALNLPTANAARMLIARGLLRLTQVMRELR